MHTGICSKYYFLPFLSGLVCVLFATTGWSSAVSSEANQHIERKIAVTESFAGRPLIKGNKVILLMNGPATYAARYKAIQNAKDHVNLEVFSIEDNERGREFADLLIKKQREGVEINLMYDSAGSYFAPHAFFERMRKNGIRVVEFNPINPFKARGSWRPWRRDHRKVVIVDGNIVITGGINFTQDYSIGPFPSEEERRRAKLLWRDTDVQIEGPAVAEFQRIFLDTWHHQEGPPLPQRNYFPAAAGQGDSLVCAVASGRGVKSDIMYSMYHAVISSAYKKIYLTNAFFIPNKATLEAFIEAAKRGVDIRLIVPGITDDPLTFHSARYYYSNLLKAGVRLYERGHRILHAKTAVIDGIWATVGSANIDYWSFFYSDEENAIIVDPQFGEQMEKMFFADIGESREIRLKEWDKRGFSEKIKEWAAHLFARML